MKNEQLTGLIKNPTDNQILEQMELIGINDDMLPQAKAYLCIYSYWEDLDNLEEAYQGEWNNDEEFVQNLLEDCGYIPENMPAYIHIDWGKTAQDVMLDYSVDGYYYFRNL